MCFVSLFCCCCSSSSWAASPHPSIHRFVRFYIFLYFFYYYLSSICPFQLLRLLLWLCEFRLTESISFILNRIMRVGHVCTNVFTVCHIYVVAFIFFSSSSSSSSVVSLVHFYSVPFCFVPFIRSFNSSHLIGWNVILQCIFSRTIVIDRRLKMRRQKWGKWRATTTTKNKWEQRASSFLPWIGT